MALDHEVGDGIDASDHCHFHDAIWRCLVPQPLLRSVVVTGRGREGGVTANLVRARLAMRVFVGTLLLATALTRAALAARTNPIWYHSARGFDQNL